MDSSPTDIELAKQSAQGHTEAFSILVERYRQKVFQTSMGFLHNTDDAEDLTQDIFVKAWNALGSFDGRSSFSTWLYRISVNKAINKLRKNKIRTFVGINDEINESTTLADDNAENNIMRREQKEEIQKAINKLKTEQKKAFVLFYYQELNMKEVAAILKITPKAAESLVFRARKNLQQELSR